MMTLRPFMCRKCNLKFWKYFAFFEPIEKFQVVECLNCKGLARITFNTGERLADRLPFSNGVENQKNSRTLATLHDLLYP